MFSCYSKDAVTELVLSDGLVGLFPVHVLHRNLEKW
jgi:hypothetical protein